MRRGHGGQLTFYPGDYDYYLDKSKATSAQTALTAGSTSNNGKPIADNRPRAGGLREQKAQKRLEAESRNAIAKARREKEKRVHELETKIAALEGQQKELAAALEDPAAYTPGGRASRDQSRSLRFVPRSCPPDGGMGKRHSVKVESLKLRWSHAPLRS